MERACPCVRWLSATEANPKAAEREILSGNHTSCHWGRLHLVTDRSKRIKTPWPKLASPMGKDGPEHTMGLAKISSQLHRVLTSPSD